MTVASSESAEQTPRPISQGKVEASVARRLRAPPEALMPQELKSVIIRLLTQPSVHLQQNCRLQLFAIGLLRGPKPAKASSLHVRRSYFGPVRNRPVRCLNLLVVEPPGTAPGSEPLITRTFIAIVRRLSQYRGVCPPAEGGQVFGGGRCALHPPRTGRSDRFIDSAKAQISDRGHRHHGHDRRDRARRRGRQTVLRPSTIDARRHDRYTEFGSLHHCCRMRFPR